MLFSNRTVFHCLHQSVVSLLVCVMCVGPIYAPGDINGAELLKAKAACDAAKPSTSTVITTHIIDMGQRDDIRRFQTEVAAAHGEVVHLLFNNAGIQIASAWDRMSEATHDKVMAINLDGMSESTKSSTSYRESARGH